MGLRPCVGSKYTCLSLMYVESRVTCFNKISKLLSHGTLFFLVWVPKKCVCVCVGGVHVIHALGFGIGCQNMTNL